LAFIYAYSRILRRPPAEADMQRHFRVSPPSVHQMVLTLERAGLIRRQPGVPRSIELLVAPQDLPILGRVDKLNPDSDAGKQHEGGEALDQLVIAGGNAA
jgi:SOS-response transcriptional repressor LexA